MDRDKIADDIIYFTLCSNINMRRVNEYLPKNIVHPFYCKKEDINYEYGRFLNLVKERIQNLSKSNNVVFYVCNPRIVERQDVGGYFEIFWMEEEIYLEKYLIDNINVDMRELSIL